MQDISTSNFKQRPVTLILEPVCTKRLNNTTTYKMSSIANYAQAYAKIKFLSLIDALVIFHLFQLISFKSGSFTIGFTPSSNDAVQSNHDVIIMKREAGWDDVVSEADRFVQFNQANIIFVSNKIET